MWSKLFLGIEGEVCILVTRHILGSFCIVAGLDWIDSESKTYPTYWLDGDCIAYGLQHYGDPLVDYNSLPLPKERHWAGMDNGFQLLC